MAFLELILFPPIWRRARSPVVPIETVHASFQLVLLSLPQTPIEALRCEIFSSLFQWVPEFELGLSHQGCIASLFTH